ncbi:hypothetical protein [Arthrobacter sp. H5]|uniref:hypothetical protein n=1 Tax=Arthrobacter sp. H5 TaxID=1267973 RepID=UPI0012DD9CD8|nr:hypothetical protein [Arthrobacter sp. H5]
MMTGLGTTARILRASATAVVVLSLATGAHLAGGGQLPGLLILAALAAATLLAVTVAAQRKLSLPAVLGILGIGQFVLHQAFNTLTTTTACLPAPGGHYGMQQVHCAPTGLEHAHAGAAPDGALMLAAHAAAVVITALMLHRGEAALVLTVQWLRPLFALPGLAAQFPQTPLPRFRTISRPSYRHPVLVVPTLRGPPATASL